jgi:hypothetical protein
LSGVVPLLAKQDGCQPGKQQRYERDQFVGDGIDGLHSFAPLARDLIRLTGKATARHHLDHVTPDIFRGSGAPTF